MRYNRLPFPLHPVDYCSHSPQWDMLDAALEDEMCLNVAVTGEYGAGKSSFLRSYFKNKGSKWRPVWI